MKFFLRNAKLLFETFIANQNRQDRLILPLMGHLDYLPYMDVLMVDELLFLLRQVLNEKRRSRNSQFSLDIR